MADLHVVHAENPPAQTPLLNSNQNHIPPQEPRQQQQQQQNEETHLDQTLKKLEKFLTFLGFKQSSWRSSALSWTAFVLISVALPVVVLELSDCSGCEMYQIKAFELDIVASQACLAAVSLLCISHNLRKYGIRKFLFVDRSNGQMSRFHDVYVRQILTAREVIRMLYVNHESWWQSVAILLALIIPWTYVSMISLSASVLFHMVCNLQVIHFDDYGKLLERESDVLVFMEEHIRLRYHLSKISHRFRIYLLLGFFVVTASQFVTLLRTTAYSGIITIINGGHFAVSTIVQVVGIIICLHAATKISHRAQGIASLASRWHALLTCSSTDSLHNRVSNNVGNLEAAINLDSMEINYSESDLDSSDYVPIPINAQLASYMSSYHKRQAFVTYLQTNPGGITIFGWTVDRALLNTLFFIELSLVTFLLGKTVVFTSN
ncbi:hypothetical protein F2P56_037211 [Juglans regia]|uniref:Uncharacterized protein n=1 Tax=Juglans regia TaxID=51240 RepID=A0A833X556_JUGRE|nr:hypothetical protein F2P56_037211 [Juglans regia]